MAKILVIEDEFDIRDEVLSWLQFEGHEVYGAENGKQGLEAILKYCPDLVLCDVSMPQMDGHEVLIELRADASFAQLPFVFLTAAADRDSMRKGMNLGADDYLTKPFSRKEVLHAVQSRLGKRMQIQAQLDHLSEVIEGEREQRLLKSRLIGMFSHDFRNPLASILVSSNILQRYTDRLTPEKRRRHFNRIDGAVHVLLQMLDEMLMVAEIEHGQLSCHPEPTDLHEMIEKIIMDFRLIDSEQHAFRFLSQLPVIMELDAQLVHHVIMNLVSNAVKYSPVGSEILIRADLEGEEVVVSVEDSGIGILEEDIPKIFNPFFRANNAHKIKGTGLGLSLVKQALDVCGGTITVTSEPGYGSCFVVRLPLHIAAMETSGK